MNRLLTVTSCLSGHFGPACEWVSLQCYRMDENGGEVGRPFRSCLSEFPLSATGWRLSLVLQNGWEWRGSGAAIRVLLVLVSPQCYRLETVLGATAWMRMEGKWGGHSGPAVLSFALVLQDGWDGGVGRLHETGGTAGEGRDWGNSQRAGGHAGHAAMAPGLFTTFTRGEREGVQYTRPKHPPLPVCVWKVWEWLEVFVRVSVTGEREREWERARVILCGCISSPDLMSQLSVWVACSIVRHARYALDCLQHA